MKRLTALILAAGMLAPMLTSCSAQKNNTNVDLPQLPDTIQLKADPGMVGSAYPEKFRITEYDFIENEVSTLLYPEICFADNTVFTFNFYPREEVMKMIGMTLDERVAYTSKYMPSRDLTIEVYEDFSSPEPDRIIALKDLPQGKFSAGNLYYISDNDTLMMNIHVKTGDSWSHYYYYYDLDGNLVHILDKKHPDWKSSGYPEKIVYCNNSIYYLEELPYNWMASSFEYKLYRYDLDTDQEIKLDTDNVLSIFETDGIVYYFTQTYDENGFAENLNLFRLDGEESVLVQESFRPENSIWLAEYDAENEILYYQHDISSLYTYHFDDGVTRLIMLSGDKNLLLRGITDDSIIVSNGHYATTAYERTTEKVSLTDNQVTLNLYRQMSPDDFDRHQDIFRIMTINGFSAKGETYAIEDTDEYQFAMAKKLLAGDTDFDIFYVSTAMSELMKGQYYEDLSQYPLLNGYYDRMVHGVKELCTIDGIPALIPVHLYTNSTRVDKSCVTGDVKLERTLEEVLKIKDDIPLKSGNYFLSGTNLYILMRPWFEQLVSNYMAEVITDKQAEKDMKLLFEMGMNLADDGDVYLNSGAINTPTLLRAVQNIGLDGSLKPEQTMVPMLKVAENYKQAWNGGFYAINPNSPNREMAAVFLACLMERDRNLGLGNAQLYADAPEKTGIVHGNGSDVMYDIYMTQLADSIRGYEIPGFSNTVRELFRKIESGEYTADDAANDLFRQVKMVKYE